jgi:hypothetical protein
MALKQAEKIWDTLFCPNGRKVFFWPNPILGCGAYYWFVADGAIELYTLS